MNIWQKVKDFHYAFNLTIADKPELPDFIDKHILIGYLRTTQQALEVASSDDLATVGIRSLRMKLLLEEVAEYIEAEIDDDFEGIADALTDIHYIAAGTEIVYGIPGQQVFNHIHANNMSKLGADGEPIYNASGKVMKPDTWEPPQIKQFL